MNSEPNIFSTLRRFGTVSGASVFKIPATEIASGDRRLEASYYGSSGYQARRSIETSGFEMTTIGEVATVLQPPIFKRCFVNNPQFGIPYLNGMELMEVFPQPDAYLSRSQTAAIKELVLERDTVVIPDAGVNAGDSVMFTTSEVEGFATTNNTIRIKGKTEKWTSEGLFAYLNSTVGNYLLTRTKYGSCIPHIEPRHVEAIAIPLLPWALMQELTQMIGRTSAMRRESSQLLAESQSQLKRSCYLPDIDAFAKSPSDRSIGSVVTFVESAKARFGNPRGYGETRFDATFHRPLALAIGNHLLSSKGGTTLGRLVFGVRNSSLRKRIYVDDESQGVPLIGGKQLIQWRPVGVNYLSRLLTRNLESEKVHRGWTLVSCGGTLGRCQFVHRNFEGWVMSQDVMRIIPDPSRVFPGFIYAFLASPYGQAQIMQRGYGSVIPRLREFQFDSIAIRVPDDKGEAIDAIITTAFDLRAKAREAEDQAISLLEEAITRGRSYVEAEWGTEY